MKMLPIKQLPAAIKRREIKAVLPWLLLLLLVAWPITLLIDSAMEREPDFGDVPDFSEIENVEARKVAFFGYLRPIVKHHNDRIRDQRAFLLEMRDALEGEGRMSRAEAHRLQRLAERYRVDLDEEEPLASIRTLLLRVDIIPVELALVQAAKESGWGRSRAALTANNLFGQWCFRPGCGIVPHRRGSGQNHELQRFDNFSSAIGAYLHNLNTHPAYKELRQLRASLRAREEQPTGLALADGLINYSERRDAYVSEVESMIRQYRSFRKNHEDA